MARIFKVLMTSSFLLLCAAVGYLIWAMATPITAENVESKIYQGCLVSNATRLVNITNFDQLQDKDWLLPGKCQCVAKTLTANLGASRAAPLADAMRLQVLEAIQAMISLAGLAAAKNTPYVADATRLAAAAKRALAACPN